MSLLFAVPRVVCYASGMDKYKHAANPERNRAMIGKRSSNAATSHDPRPRKERTRKDMRRAAIRRDTE